MDGAKLSDVGGPLVGVAGLSLRDLDGLDGSVFVATLRELLGSALSDGDPVAGFTAYMDVPESDA
jgi:FXSXX-COOH protein